jgi:tRNA dimethylallyltransferase
VRDALAWVPVLAAPTASGKTATVLRLAERWPLEVVSADAMQVYRGLAIGTASPDADQRARVPHHLVGVIDPATPFSVAAYVRAAETVIAEVGARGRVPLVVGGTGFYLNALAEGLPTTPPADREVQAAIAAELAAVGLEPLLRELAVASPADAGRTQRNPRRVVRAVEVLRRTGAPPSAFPPRPPRFRYAFAVALPAPETLQARVRQRTRALIEAGWLEEVAALAPSMHAWATARQAIGYEPLRRVLTGELRLEDALAGIEQATLRYAKRQRTWFRRRPPTARRWLGTVCEHEADLELWLRELTG